MREESSHTSLPTNLWTVQRNVMDGTRFDHRESQAEHRYVCDCIKGYIIIYMCMYKLYILFCVYLIFHNCCKCFMISRIIIIITLN